MEIKCVTTFYNKIDLGDFQLSWESSTNRIEFEFEDAGTRNDFIVWLKETLHG